MKTSQADQNNNPFEYDCVADSYDLVRARKQVVFQQDGRFKYPAVFGSSGGGNFVNIMRDLESVATDSMRFLEVGCGVGAFYEVLRMNGFKQSYTGLDYSAEHIRRASAYYPEASFTVGSAVKLPFADESFDVVFENNLFPFLVDPLQAIREMARVSRGFIRIVCHATPIRGGVYCGQPIYTPVTVESNEEGVSGYVLAETIAPAMRPQKILPKLMRATGPATMKLVLAQVHKYYVNVDDLEKAIAALPARVIRSHRSPVGKYPAVMTLELTRHNSRERLLERPDGKVTEDDVLIDIDGMDVFYMLGKQAGSGREDEARL